MTTATRTMNRLKSLFQGIIANRKPAEGRYLAAVVYRRVRGNLEILALEDRKGALSIPSGQAKPGESEEEFLKSLIAGFGLGSGDLKIWQSLGRFPAGKSRVGVNLADCFLVQSLVDAARPEEDKRQPAAPWLAVEEVLEKTDGDTAGIIMLAVAKLKRAQI